MDKRVSFSLPEAMLRTYCEMFSVKDMKQNLARMGIKASLKETRDFIESSSLVFPLENGMYITRAGAFTSEFFSIKPTSVEWAARAFVSGDRCIPFADMSVHPADYDFIYKCRPLERKSINVDADTAIDMHLLYGEEYASQYIAADPANEGAIDLALTDFALPMNVKLSAFDFTPLIEDGFKRNDRIICFVDNWAECKIFVDFDHDSGENVFDRGVAGEKRSRWYGLLEKYLLESFDVLGPCNSIDEQLANVFFEHRKELCGPYCGSVEEFMLEYTKKIAVEYFGVETRLWRKNEPVPAVGKWNSAQLQKSNEMNRKSGVTHFLFSVPDFILDQYIYDMFFHKQDDIEEVKRKILGGHYNLTPFEEKIVNLHLTERSAILRTSYNWFADQTSGQVRSRVLDLYSPVAWLVFRLDCVDGSLENFPQQELVILSQLYSHLMQMLESLAGNDHIDEDSGSLLLSLDGMQFNYEEIASTLENAINEQHRKKFTVVK